MCDHSSEHVSERVVHREYHEQVVAAKDARIAELVVQQEVDRKALELQSKQTKTAYALLADTLATIDACIGDVNTGLTRASWQMLKDLVNASKGIGTQDATRR